MPNNANSNNIKKTYEQFVNVNVEEELKNGKYVAYTFGLEPLLDDYKLCKEYELTLRQDSTASIMIGIYYLVEREDMEKMIEAATEILQHYSKRTTPFDNFPHNRAYEIVDELLTKWKHTNNELNPGNKIAIVRKIDVAFMWRLKERIRMLYTTSSK